MLTNLRMNMPSVDCPVVLLPSDSMDSGSEIQGRRHVRKKLGSYIFFQLKEDGNRLDLVMSEDLRHFFTDETGTGPGDTLDWYCTNSVACRNV
jgi:hypothetical protein